jgi:hypothetical protein
VQLAPRAQQGIPVQPAQQAQRAQQVPQEPKEQQDPLAQQEQQDLLDRMDYQARFLITKHKRLAQIPQSYP